MSSERDELAELLAKHEDCAFSASGVLVCSCGTAMRPNEAQWDLANLAAHQADVLTAAGYRKPQQVTTVEELDALPVRSVVLDSMDGPVVKVGGWWHSAYRRFAPDEIALPATVLHVGGTE